MPLVLRCHNPHLTRTRALVCTNDIKLSNVLDADSSVMLSNLLITRKTAGTVENPARQQTTFCDIPIKVVILLLANISISYRSPSTQNQSDLDFDLSRSFKDKGDNVTGLAIYGCLLMVNSNIGPNSAPLRDIEIRVTLTLTFQCHSRSIVIMSLDSSYLVSH